MYVIHSSKSARNVFLETQILWKSTAAAKPQLKINESSEDYQYLQRCSLPTMHFQKSLLKLPIPELEKTCERYLNALKPILNSNQYNKTKDVVEKFKEQDGKDLQIALKVKDNINKHTSYISKPWFDMYLKDRTPLPLNYNPVLVMNRSTHQNAETQLCKATNATISSLRFMKSLKANILAPEVFHLNPEKTDTNLFLTCMGLLPSIIASYGAYLVKAYPLDMSQYSSLFNSTRIPQEEKDILVKDDSGRHVLVMKGGHFFKVDVLDENGDILPPQDIFTCYKYILNLNLPPCKNSIAVLTTENRDIWARARTHIVSIHPNNFQIIKVIDSALFVLCLDDDILGEDLVKAMRLFLHGDGTNRWFDKSFSLLISKDGHTALNFEHAWGDGVAVLRYFKDIFADMNNNLFVNSDTEPSNISPEKYVKKLEIIYDDKVLEDIKSAQEKYNKICSSLGIDVTEHQGLGRNLCKKNHISPDAVMQLSFQVAYHKVYGNFVSTYESCSTAAFKHGRTETIRPCTEATRSLALAMNGQNKPGKDQLLIMIKQCSEVHKNLTKDAAMGQGFDRHLFGLKNICEELGRPLPDFYKDEAYKIINYNILSTSTLFADAVKFGGFGPVVPDGLGVGYTIQDDFCGSMVTSYTANRNGADFVNALKITFNEVKTLLA